MGGVAAGEAEASRGHLEGVAVAVELKAGERDDDSLCAHMHARRPHVTSLKQGARGGLRRRSEERGRTSPDLGVGIERWKPERTGLGVSESPVSDDDARSVADAPSSAIFRILARLIA